MTRTLSVANGDLVAGFAVVEGREATRQRVIQRLRLVRGEAWLDAIAGIAYFDDIIGARLPSVLATPVIADAIREVVGVDDVSGVDVTLDATTNPARPTIYITADVTAGGVTAPVRVTL